MLKILKDLYLITLFTALGGIHRFHLRTKLLFKDWIVAVTNDSEVIISQHFKFWMSSNPTANKAKPFSKNICLFVPHCTFVFPGDKFLLGVYWVDCKDWGEYWRHGQKLIPRVSSIEIQDGCQSHPTHHCGTIFSANGLPRKEECGAQRNLCKLLPLQFAEFWQIMA